MAVDIGPALGLTADSSSLTLATEELKDLSAAAKQAQSAAQGLVGATDKAAASAGKAARATDEQTSSLTVANRAALELARSEFARAQAALSAAKASGTAAQADIDSAQAALQLARAHRDAANAAVMADRAHTATAQGMMTAAASADRMGTSIRNANGHTTNLMFQFQDIGMMMAAGQSPLMLAMQQGTQVSGVFRQLEGSGTSAFSAIKGGLLAMVSPMSLMTLGVIAGGAALVQWGMSALTAGEETRSFGEVVDELQSSVSAVNEISRNYSADGLQSMLDKYGEINGEILAMIENQKTFTISEAMESARAAAQVLRDEYGYLVDRLEHMNFDTVGRAAIPAQLALKAMTDELGLGLEKGMELSSALKDLSAAATFEDQAAALRRVNDLLSKSKIATSETAKAALDAEDAMRQLSKSVPDANWMSAALSGVYSLGEAIRARIGEARTLAGAAGGAISGSGRGGDPREFGALPGQSNTFDTENFGLPPSDTGGSGGGGGTNQRATQLESLIDSLRTERETVEIWRAEQMELLTQYSDAELAAIGGINEAKVRLEQEYQERISGIRDAANGGALADAASFFGGMAELAKAGGERTLKITQGLAATQAVINSYLAFTEVLKDPAFIGRPWARAGAAAAALAQGLGAVASIRGASSGGGSGGAGRSAAAAATTAPANPAVVSIAGLNPSDLYSGASVIGLVDAVQKEFKARGAIIQFV